MASEILGLFGGKNPQQLQQDYLSGLMVSPAQMGNQSLLQQLIATGANAGAKMGYGGGRLLGGKVAGEVEAAYIDEAVKIGNAVKGTPAQKMKAVADALAEKPGMGKQYLMALNESRRLEAEDLTLEDAKFKAANRTRDRKETRMVRNAEGELEPKQFYWTEDLINGVWVKATMPSDTPPPKGDGAGGGDGEKEAKLKALAKKRAAIGEGDNQSQAESERLLNSGGLVGAGPEVIPAPPNEQPMTFPSAAQQPASPAQMSPDQMQQAGVPAAMVKQVVDYQKLVDTVKRMKEAGVDTTAIERELGLRYKRLKDLGLVK